MRDDLPAVAELDRSARRVQSRIDPSQGSVVSPATQTNPKPTAMSAHVGPDAPDRLHDLLALRIDPHDRLIVGVDDPDTSDPHRDRRGSPAERNVGHDVAGVRVDHRHGVRLDDDGLGAAGDREDDSDDRGGQEECTGNDRESGAAEQTRAPFFGRGRCASRERGRRIEFRIVLEDRLLELAELAARLQPELIGEQVPAAAVDVERVRLPSRAVEREHQLRPPAFPERIVANKRLEFGDQLRVPAERKFGLDSLLDGRRVTLLEVCALRPRHRLVEIGERWPAPECQRGLQPLRSRRWITPLRVREQRVEAIEVDGARLGRDHVARRLRHDRVVAEHLP